MSGANNSSLAENVTTRPHDHRFKASAWVGSEQPSNEQEPEFNCTTEQLNNLRRNIQAVQEH